MNHNRSHTDDAFHPAVPLTRPVMVGLFAARWHAGDTEPVPFMTLWKSWRAYLEASRSSLTPPEVISARCILHRTLDSLVRSGYLACRDDAYRWAGK